MKNIEHVHLGLIPTSQHETYIQALGMCLRLSSNNQLLTFLLFDLNVLWSRVLSSNHGAHCKSHQTTTRCNEIHPCQQLRQNPVRGGQTQRMAFFSVKLCLFSTFFTFHCKISNISDSFASLAHLSTFHSFLPYAVFMRWL